MNEDPFVLLFKALKDSREFPAIRENIEKAILGLVVSFGIFPANIKLLVDDLLNDDTFSDFAKKFLFSLSQIDSVKNNVVKILIDLVTNTTENDEIYDFLVDKTKKEYTLNEENIANLYNMSNGDVNSDIVIKAKNLLEAAKLSKNSEQAAVYLETISICVYNTVMEKPDD